MKIVVDFGWMEYSMIKVQVRPHHQKHQSRI